MDYSEYDSKKPSIKPRIKAFADVFHENFKQYLIVGLLFVLAMAPLVFFRYYVIAYQTELKEAISSGAMEADAIRNYYAMNNIFYAACIVLVLPVALVAAGCSKAVKYTLWQMPTPFKDNFGEGVKENAWSFIACFEINVVLCWLCSFIWNANANYEFWYYLPTIVYVAVLLPASLWFLSATTVYKGGFFQRLTNSFKFYVSTLLQSLVATVGIFAPLALLFIAESWVQILVPFLFAAIWLVPSFLAWQLFTFKYFDKYVNATAFPDLVDKGLKQ